MYPIQDFVSDIAGIACETDAMAVRRMSRDRHAVSPVLRKALAGKVADIIVSPRDKPELMRVISAAVKHRIPITERGGGTANYGQSVPLYGGILFDMTKMSGVVWAKPGAIRALSGTLILDMNAAAEQIGWELRFHPTTAKTATIGGFIAGGSAGCGSITWGVLRDRGNILAVEGTSMEETPRVIELRGRDARLVHHAYGTNCIITEVEMPTAPRYDWVEAVVAFPDFDRMIRFAAQLGIEDGILKKLLTINEWPVPHLMEAIRPLVPQGHSMVLAMIASNSIEEFRHMVEDFKGSVVSEAAPGQGPYKVPLYEFSQGHALLQVQRTEPRRTSIEGFYSSSDLPGLIERVRTRLGNPGPFRLDMRRWAGKFVGNGSPLFIYENDEQMAGIVRNLQAEGVNVANSHTSSIKAVGKKEPSDRDVSFKRSMDPYNLLNPGRFDLEEEGAGDNKTLPAVGWVKR